MGSNSKFEWSNFEFSESELTEYELTKSERSKSEFSKSEFSKSEFSESKRSKSEFSKSELSKSGLSKYELPGSKPKNPKKTSLLRQTRQQNRLIRTLLSRWLSATFTSCVLHHDHLGFDFTSMG